MDFKSSRNNFYLMMGITLVVMVIVLKDDFKGVLLGLLTADIKWLLLACLGMVVCWIIDAVIYYVILKATVDKIRFSFILKLMVATQFFNGITPFASGGQPFQIYAINKHTGVGYGKITSSSLQNFILYQTALVAYGFFALGAHWSLGSSTLVVDAKNSFLILIGFLVNFGVIAGLVAISRFDKLNRFVSNNVISFLGQIRIIKNVEARRESTNNFLTDFHHEIGNLTQNKKVFYIGLFLNLLKLTIFYGLSYVLCLAVGINNISFFAVILASAYTMLLTSLVPLPGASGGAELGFLAFFGGMLAGPLSTTVMLLWRFFTYYMGLGVGFLTFTFGFKEREQSSGVSENSLVGSAHYREVADRADNM